MTLAIYIFRALIAFIASFKLKIKQYNIINIFINSLINKEIFINYLKNIILPLNIKNLYLFLFKAFYSLKQLPLL